ncbi:HPP family protein [Ancylobacter dichloromethanicus]
MSTGLVSIEVSASAAEARSLLVQHDVRRLPVLGEGGAIVGVVGLRELAGPGASVREVMTAPSTAPPQSAAISLLDRFARDRVHAVFIIDEARRPLGVITEADWLAVLTRGLA